MLLYARTVPPKQAKKRSRAGCAFCKEKKKKCDEVRPSCGRCIELSKECIYEGVKPRQRRRPDAAAEVTAVEGSSDFATTFGKLSVGPGDATYDNAMVPEEQYNINDANESFTELFDASPRMNETHDSTAASQMQLVRKPPSPQFELRIPAFSDISGKPQERLLLNHFHNVLSHLIVLQEDDGNPFQRLVVPMAHRSQAVRSAIFALSSAHKEFQGGRPDDGSLIYHNQTIRSLAKLIAQGSVVNKNELMATVILLIYYEVLMQEGRSSFVAHHLKGAIAIMKEHSTQSDATSAFLERAFQFYDVIAALSLGTPSLMASSSSTAPTPLIPVDARGANRPAGSADVLLGMATSLWPTMQKLSDLSGLKAELQAAVVSGDADQEVLLRAKLERSALDVEAALKTWQPEISNVSAAYEGILNSAMAYQHSGIVYLYRSVRGVPTSHSMVQQHTHASLCHCSATVKGKGPMGALLWPLFVAACEAQTVEDRAMAREAFGSLHRRQRMTNIERSWAIVQEVWRRADRTDGNVPMDLDFGENLGILPDVPAFQSMDMASDLWREISQEMGLRVVFG